jgi:hypothetical protein
MTTTTDPLWQSINRALDRIETEKPTTFDAVKAILDAGTDPKPNADAAFFGGSGGDRDLWESLYAAGWRETWEEASYYYVMQHRTTGETLTYIEGDVERGDQHPLTPAEQVAALIESGYASNAGHDFTSDLCEAIAAWVANYDTDPINADNIAEAIHAYRGTYESDADYAEHYAGWNDQPTDPTELRDMGGNPVPEWLTIRIDWNASALALDSTGAFFSHAGHYFEAAQ